MDVSDVARLSERRVELRDYQSALLNAETAALNGLDCCARSVSAFVGLLRDANLSVVHPLVRDVLSRIPSIMQQAANLPYEVAECHSILQKIIETSHEIDIVVTGEISKHDPVA